MESENNNSIDLQPRAVDGGLCAADDEEGDWLDCGWGDFMPVRDALIGKTDADNYRHTIVRWAFMEEIWQDPKVEDLVDHWAKMTGLGELAIRLACSGERLADLVGLDYRAELLNPPCLQQSSHHPSECRH